MELTVEPIQEPRRQIAPPGELAALAPRAPDAFHLDVDVPLPTDLRRFGGSTRAAASGNPDGPIIVVLGGISGNRFVCRGRDGGEGWWPGLVGTGCTIDPSHHLIVGLDFAADPTGAAAPSTADQARVLAAALDALGLGRADVVIGASYGGMVALALAALAPERVERLVIISAGAQPHAAATAARELQRRVVALGLETGRGDDALAIARGMAMMTYRTRDEFAERFDGGIAGCCPRTPSAPGAYLRARGEHFCTVMSPERFLSLSASIDRHEVDPARIAAPALLIGADTDQLVTPEQMRDLAASLRGPAELHLLDCLYGHDMFLKEAEAVGRIAAPFIPRLA